MFCLQTILPANNPVPDDPVPDDPVQNERCYLCEHPFLDSPTLPFFIRKNEKTTTEKQFSKLKAEKQKPAKK
jgi:hypothetical protein